MAWLLGSSSASISTSIECCGRQTTLCMTLVFVLERTTFPKDPPIVSLEICSISNLEKIKCIWIFRSSLKKKKKTLHALRRTRTLSPKKSYIRCCIFRLLWWTRCLLMPFYTDITGHANNSKPLVCDLQAELVLPLVPCKESLYWNLTSSIMVVGFFSSR